MNIIFITSESDKFTKEEKHEIKDALENSLKYYQDLLDDALTNPEAKKRGIEYARARIRVIESITRKLDVSTKMIFDVQISE